MSIRIEQVRVGQQPWSDRIGLVLEGVRVGGDRHLLQFELPSWEIVPEGGQVVPSLEFAREDLQKIVDALAAYGITPSVPAPQASELAAIKYHLEDMRRLAFWSVAQ